MNRCDKNPKGFALVVTLSLMVLLAVVVVGMLSLASVSLRTEQMGGARAAARANARLALSLAIADLQKNLGPDRRISGRADLVLPAAGQPLWTAAWNAEESDPDPKWLVSGAGSNISPDMELTESESALIASFPDGEDPLRAPLVEVTRPGGMSGAYSYWVGDEGVKARVDLVGKEEDPSNNSNLRRVLTMSPQISDISKLGADFSDEVFEATGGEENSRLISLETLGMVAGQPEVIPKRYFNDLTIGGYGLPVDVREGGFKTDLSMVFDRTQQNEDFVSRVLGATPGAFSMDGATVYDFSQIEQDVFYLSKSIQSNVSIGVGPNWGILFNYARLWENKLSGSQYQQVGVQPNMGTDVRWQHWRPYMREGPDGNAYASDRQHVNHPLTPVISMLQMGVYLGAKQVASPTSDPSDTKKYYQPQLHIKPLMGLWNPYNVPIRAEVYQLEWAIAPFLRLDFQKPGADGSFAPNSGYLTRMWLRDYWLLSSQGMLPTDSSIRGGSYIRLRTTSAIDFQPGEFRLFSAGEVANLSSNFNGLVPTYNPLGSYRFDVKVDSAQSTGGAANRAPLIVPEGYYGWFEDVYLQDTHWNGATSAASGKGGTREFFKDQLNEDANTTYFTLKKNTGARHLSRYSNLWNGGRNEESHQPYLPEPIVSARTGSGPGKTAHRIEDLASSGFLAHIGTWRFTMRNPGEIEDDHDENQRLRGWIDSNPVAASGNLLFDGSRSTAAGREGWGALSQFTPGAHRSGAARGVVGDGYHGNRGLVAEGEVNRDNAIPQGTNGDTRWQGYFGPSTSAVDGVTHSIIYDVPQIPLVSLGQFQHAAVSRYQHEPGFVIGNSYANPRIPLGQTEVKDFTGISGMNIVDSSYEINERLWDKYFFSTLAPDYQEPGSDSSRQSKDYDDFLSFEDIAAGNVTLPNPRMKFRIRPGDEDFTEIISSAGDDAPEAMASRIRIAGAFNVNSTSVAAWQAFLSGLGATGLPSINPVTGGVSWNSPDGLRFNRFSQTITDQPYEDGSDIKNYWQGWRKLDDKQLEDLAKAMVEQVKTRGPFLSMADFVNRDPEASSDDEKRKGALQAALDEAINNKLSTDIGKPVTAPNGAQFDANVFAGENETAGSAAYLLQGDVLQSLAPAMQVRSDYFKVRAYGDARDSSGQVIARAWCEAYVQRTPDFVDGVDLPETGYDDSSVINRTFGRRFKIMSFRWLSATEI